MRIIIPGASGFIGKNFLLRSPKLWEIIGIYNTTRGFPDFVKERNLNNVIPVRCDLTDRVQVERLGEKFNNEFDVCLFLAANGNPTFSVLDPIMDIRKNTESLLNFLEVFHIERLIYLSSGAVYDGLKGLISPHSKLAPTLPYAISNLASEQYIKFYTHKKRSVEEYIILRFFGAYGPFEPARKIYTKLVHCFGIQKRNTYVIHGNGENLIDAMYIDDAIDGIMKVISSKERNATVDFASGNPLTINALVEKASRVFGIPEVKITHEGSVPEFINFYTTGQEMYDMFGFKPTTKLSDGLSKLLNFYNGRE